MWRSDGDKRRVGGEVRKEGREGEERRGERGERGKEEEEGREKDTGKDVYTISNSLMEAHLCNTIIN